MPIEIKCPNCQRRMRVPDTAVGKKVKCPKCQKAIAVAAPDEQEETYTLKIEEGDEFGPVTKAELDEWYEDGRITEDCQILRSGGDQWQWATDIYPDLEEDESEGEPPPIETPETPADPPAIDPPAIESPTIEPPGLPAIESTAPSPPTDLETNKVEEIATDDDAAAPAIEEKPVEVASPKSSTPAVQEAPAPAPSASQDSTSRVTTWLLVLLIANLFFTLMSFIFLLINQFRS